MVSVERNNIKQLSSLLRNVIEQNLSKEAFEWLLNKVDLIVQEEKSMQLHLCFAHLPRIASRTEIEITSEDQKQMEGLLPGFSIVSWTRDRLCRVWLLTQIPSADKVVYLQKITILFSAAEMNEQVALYSALPFYHYPEEWIARCEEGIRSNIGTVLEAIMYHNPYPAAFLAQPAWNQLVLKAFFTEKDVKQIVGLKDRNNEALAATLEDYVQERLAAHRVAAPEIYELIEQMKQKI